MKLILSLLLSLSYLSAEAYIEIDIQNEIALSNGMYLTKEYYGPRYALISHSHGRFEGSNIAQAACSGGYLVSELPTKFNEVIKHILKDNDFVLTVCREDF